MPNKTPSLFAAQELAEKQSCVIEGLRLAPAHVDGYQRLRRVLGLSPAEAKAVIEDWDTMETICAQACVGTLTPVELGRRVNENFNELLAE